MSRLRGAREYLYQLITQPTHTRSGGHQAPAKAEWMRTSRPLSSRSHLEPYLAEDIFAPSRGAHSEELGTSIS